jgi:hypothetical protein
MEKIEIKVIRLKTGEDIIARVVQIGNMVIVKEPLRLLYMMTNAGGAITVALIEWIFPRVSEVKEVTLNSTDILFIIPPTESLVKYYDEYLLQPDQSDITEEAEEQNVVNIGETFKKLKKEKLN